MEIEIITLIEITKSLKETTNKKTVEREKEEKEEKTTNAIIVDLNSNKLIKQSVVQYQILNEPSSSSKIHLTEFVYSRLFCESPRCCGLSKK